MPSTFYFGALTVQFSPPKTKAAYKWQRYPRVVPVARLNEEIPRLNAELNHLPSALNTATGQ